MSALQQDEVGTAGLAHRAAQWGSSLQLLNQWTGRKGYRLTIAVADLKLGLLEISTIFVPFRQNRSTRLKSLSCISFLRHFSLPHPLFFFFLSHQGRRFSLPRLEIAEGGTEHGGCFFPFPPASSIPKEDAQLRGTHTDTLELLILPSPSLFSPFKTLQDGFTFCFGKLRGIHVGEGGGSHCFY